LFFFNCFLNNNFYFILQNHYKKSAELDLTGHESAVESLSFSATQPNIIATASSKTVRIWDLRSAKCTFKIPNFDADCFSLSFQPGGGELLAIVDKSKALTIVDSRTGKKLFKQTLEAAVNDLKWDTTGKVIATPDSGSINLMRITRTNSASAADESMQVDSVYNVQAHTGTIYSIDFDPTGKYFAAGSADSTVSVWSIPEMICLKTMSKLEQAVSNIGFSYDGKLLAVAYEGNEIDIVSF